MGKKVIKPFYVITFDVNAREFVKYDVMPYFINCYKKEKKKKRPVTFEEYRRFVEGNSLYMYWARCQYEVILEDWPCGGVKRKIDVHWQIKNNLDLVTELVMNNTKPASRKPRVKKNVGKPGKEDKKNGKEAENA